MLKVIVIGAAGRMGSRIIGQVQNLDDVKLAAAVEAKGHPALGSDAGDRAGTGPLGIQITEHLETALDGGDVVIDFSTPDCAMAYLDELIGRRIPAVIGTTGFGPDQLQRIRNASARVPFVMAPNMSIAVNVMFKVAADIAKLLGPDYDLEIIETHHRFKKDAPSGTALRLAEGLAAARNRKLEDLATYARKGILGERRPNEIGIQAVRAGDVIGEHTVIFGGIGERLEITHRAQSRDNFARGAILAAQWVVQQPPRLYEMADVLGLSP